MRFPAGGKVDKMTKEAEGLASTLSSDVSKAADAVSKVCARSRSAVRRLLRGRGYE